jgi:hypothetical protein
MANPPPIQQRIEADLKKEGFKDAARQIKAVGDATEKSGEQAAKSSPKIRTREQRLSDMRKELVDLNRVEGRHEERVKKAGIADERAIQLSRRRQARIEKLSRALSINQRNQDRANESVRRGARVQGEAAGAASGLAASIGSMATAFAGPAGAIALMDLFRSNVEATNRALTEQARLARDAALATLDLHALSFKFNPGDEQFIQDSRVEFGRSKQELASAFTSFKSGTPFLDEGDQRAFFREAVLVPGQATTGSIQPLAELAAKASAIEDDPKKLANLIAGLNQQSGEGDPSRIAAFVVDLLEPGKAAGLTIEETFGLFAFGTRSQSASKASTQARNLVIRFQGDEQTKETLASLGVNATDFRGQIDELSALKPDAATINKLAGLENFALLASLLSRPKEFEQANVDLEQFGDFKGSRFDEFIAEVESKNKNLALAKQQARQEQRTSIVKEKSTRGQEADLARGVVEQLLVDARERGDLTPLDVEQKLETFDTAIGAGFSPSTAAQFAENAIVAPSISGLKIAATRAAAGPLGILPSIKRNLFGTPELSDVVDEELAGQREITPGGREVNVTVINGTVINQALDATRDDLAEGRPVN